MPSLLFSRSPVALATNESHNKAFESKPEIVLKQTGELDRGRQEAVQTYFHLNIYPPSLTFLGNVVSENCTLEISRKSSKTTFAAKHCYFHISQLATLIRASGAFN